MNLRVHRALAAAGIGLLLAGCTTATGPGTGPATEFDSPAGRTLTLSRQQLRAATRGATPVSFGKPSHGQLNFGPGGSLEYTPQQGFSGIGRMTLTTTTALNLYAVDSPPLGTAGVDINDAPGSAIALVPGSPEMLYGLTDRGPLVDGQTPGTKVSAVPAFNPHITEFRLGEGVAAEQRRIGLKDPAGIPFTGLVNPAGDTGQNIVGPDGAPLPRSEHGLDPEGLVALSDGTFWVSDEYGPFLIHFDANGKELQRLSPADGTLPGELSMRSPNQGMEGLTITPDGSTLVGIMQSALRTPGLTGSAKEVPFTRIVTVNLADKAVSEYLYPLADPQRSGVAVSEITAISNTAFLVDERDGKFGHGADKKIADKKIYVADISGATDVGPHSTVAGSAYRAKAGGLLLNGEPLESLIGVTTDSAAATALQQVGIQVAAKTMKLDLAGLLTRLDGDGNFFNHDRIEGLATPDGGKTIIVSNDSDFGVSEVSTTSPSLILKPKGLPDGRQDSVEFLSVDTSQLPPPTETTTIAVKVG